MDMQNYQKRVVESLRKDLIQKMELVIDNAKRAIQNAKGNQVVNSLGELQMTAHSADMACVRFAEAQKALQVMEQGSESW